MAMTGIVNYGVAIPIIMGQNIGTCITALLSGIGAKKNAKRVAAVHLYFNLIGTLLFMALFYGINAFVNFDFLGNSINAVGIAVIHTIFNILATSVLLPFSKLVEKLAVITIKDSAEEEDDEFRKLDVRFLESPGYAVKLSSEMAIKMAKISRKGFLKAVNLFKKYESKEAKKVKDIENRVDRYEDEIGSYLLKLSTRDLNKDDNNVLTLILHSLGEYERISDHAVNIMYAAKEMESKGLSFSKCALGELEVLIRAVTNILNDTIDAFANLDISKAKTIEPLEEVIDSLNNEIKNRHVLRLKEEIGRASCRERV